MNTIYSNTFLKYMWFIGMLAVPFGLQAALVDNGDGTVTDTDRTIMWLKSPGPDANWENAVAWADGLVYAGYDDWRLPTAEKFGIAIGPDTGWNSMNNEFGHLYGGDLGNPSNLSGISPLAGYNPLWYWISSNDKLGAFMFFWSFDGVWLNKAARDQPGYSDASVLHVTAVRTGPVKQLSVIATGSTPTCILGNDPSGGIIEIWNSGGGSMSYTISEGIGWLSCTPTSGESTGEHDIIAMNYSTAGLTAGTYNGTITVTAPGAAGSQQTISVALTVNLPAEIGVLLDGAHLVDGVGTVSFGTVLSGQSSPSQTFTVTNTGGAILTLGTVTLAGDDAVDYLLDTSGLANPLAPGASATFTMTFDPAGDGSCNAIIHIASNDIDENPFDIAISGTCVATALRMWRLIHFGSPENSGDGADLNDFDKDGIPNILEFAFGVHPKQNSAGMLPIPQRSGNNYVVSFTQPVGVSGITYGAEWSQTLLAGSWTAVADTGNTGAAPRQHIFSVPIGTKTKLYMRLNVTNQPFISPPPVVPPDP